MHHRFPDERMHAVSVGLMGLACLDLVYCTYSTVCTENGYNGWTLRISQLLLGSFYCM